MAKKMLIDAAHSEEVRVAVVDGDRLEEFESESATKKQIKGSIYLAKIIRIEPSLQAAFVDFGGNRHGFLPFNEIHSDYYRIPIADRNKLIVTPPPRNFLESDEESKKSTAADISLGTTNDKSHTIEIKLEDDLSLPDLKPSSTSTLQYKIQEVIKPRQIMLVQVVKEERGEKGAALTTFLTLAGRYCVLMPNSGGRGGGISRKINDAQDRRRLKEILEELEIPNEMSLIVRTAGQSRTKIEIKRDYDYLIRLWAEIRDTTLKSIAPSLIHSEGDLIKRSIRDVYTRDIDEILVDGEEPYKQAKVFMKNIIPSHAKKVKKFNEESMSLFAKYRVDDQVDTMMYPKVMLPSGGSIVINPTEALVSIDVNSGRSTKERHIDETAYKTNLEAADEIARQLRLRDIGGLIVIDFIDMTDQKHIQQVERRLKDATKSDRARIQVGRIGQFGLLELSRQRLRLSLMETNTVQCHLCQGTGLVRSTESTALYILRGIEKHGIEGLSAEIQVQVPASVSLYILNEKRSSLNDIEKKYDIKVYIIPDERFITPDYTVTTIRYHKSEDKRVHEKHTSEKMMHEISADLGKNLETTKVLSKKIPQKSPSSLKIEQELSPSNLEEPKGSSGSRGRRRRRGRSKKDFSSSQELIDKSSRIPEDDISKTSVIEENSQKFDNAKLPEGRRRSRNRRRRRSSNQNNAESSEGFTEGNVKENSSSVQKNDAEKKIVKKEKKSGWLKRIFGDD